MPARRPDRNSLVLPQLLDMSEVAARLSTTERHVRRLVSERRIPFVRVGRFIRFDPADVAAWLEERTEPEGVNGWRPSASGSPGEVRPCGTSGIATTEADRAPARSSAPET